MYEVCVILEKGAPALVLFTVYETSFPPDSHVMVAVVNVLELFTCTKFEGAAGDPVECFCDVNDLINTWIIHYRKYTWGARP